MARIELDNMIEFCLEAISSDDELRINAAAREMALKWPSEPALSFCFALTAAASLHSESFIDMKGSNHRAYQLVALLAADIYALETLEKLPTTGDDLLNYWRSEDPFFLNI